MKKTIIMTIVSVLWVSSVALAYYSGFSNMGGFYTNFNGILFPGASYQDVEEYINDGKAYVNACNNDIQTIIEARDNAIRKVNNDVNMWKISH